VAGAIYGLRLGKRSGKHRLRSRHEHGSRHMDTHQPFVRRESQSRRGHPEADRVLPARGSRSRILGAGEGPRAFLWEQYGKTRATIGSGVRPLYDRRYRCSGNGEYSHPRGPVPRDSGRMIFAMMDNLAYQPGRGQNWIIHEDGDGPEVGRNNDLWDVACRTGRMRTPCRMTACGSGRSTT
jgi:hypothetical protein